MNPALPTPSVSETVSAVPPLDTTNTALVSSSFSSIDPAVADSAVANPTADAESRSSEELSILDSLEADLLAVEQAIVQLDQLWAPETSGDDAFGEPVPQVDRTPESITEAILRAVPEQKFPALDDVH